jgi:UDP-glucose 4-epimerase
MNVLVTGSAGFIGTWVRDALHRDGHVMTGFDGERDVRDARAIAKAIEDDQVEAVINLAGVLGTAETFGDGERHAADVNIVGAVTIFDAAAKAGIPVVQIGTGHKGQPNPYAITKGAAEDLALARARWKGERIAVVRAYHAYGPGQKPFPPHGPSRVRKIIPSFVCRALTGMPLEINGDGTQLIDLVHVADVADVLVAAIGGPYGEVTEAGTGKATSVYAAASEVIARCGGSAARIAHVPMRDGEPEGTTVVAKNPACADHPWPHRLTETIAAYRDYLAAKGIAA